MEATYLHSSAFQETVGQIINFVPAESPGWDVVEWS